MTYTEPPDRYFHVKGVPKFPEHKHSLVLKRKTIAMVEKLFNLYRGLYILLGTYLLIKKLKKLVGNKKKYNFRKTGKIFTIQAYLKEFLYKSLT